MAEIENRFKEFLDEDMDYLKNIYEYPKELEGAELLFLRLDEPCYSGSLMAIYRKDGKLFENHDSHCSCYGFESWGPEETTIEALEKRKPEKSFEWEHERLSKFITVLKKEGLHGVG